MGTRGMQRMAAKYVADVTTETLADWFADEIVAAGPARFAFRIAWLVKSFL